MGKANTPGCNSGGGCCGAASCTLTADDFNRADDTDLGGAWDEQAGAAAIVSNAVELTANNTRVIAATANPDDGHTIVTVSIKLVSGSAVALVFLGWADASNYLYARVSQTQLKVGKQGGVEETVSISLTTGTYYQLVLCFTGTTLMGQINANEAIAFGVTAPGNQHGFGCQTANVVIDNFSASKTSEACGGCSYLDPPPLRLCEYCQEGGIHPYWSADVSGIGNGTCDNCDVLNGLYLFPAVQGGLTGACGDCDPRGIFALTPCDDLLPFGFLACLWPSDLFAYPPTEYASFFNFNSGGFGSYMRWVKGWGVSTDPANKVNCDGIDDTELDYYDDDGRCTGGTVIISRYFP